ncbi:Uncharacterised protein [Chlamydia trachomatis]|nr:Uncharacterised protein [Chlamydia trachomatis]
MQKRSKLLISCGLYTCFFLPLLGFIFNIVGFFKSPNYNSEKRAFKSWNNYFIIDFFQRNFNYHFITKISLKKYLGTSKCFFKSITYFLNSITFPVSKISPSICEKLLGIFSIFISLPNNCSTFFIFVCSPL